VSETTKPGRTEPAPLDGDVVAAQADRLSERFTESVGEPEVAYALHGSPIGELLVARTPTGVVRVAFADTQDVDEVLAHLATAVSPRILRSPRRLDTARRALDDYFAGRRQGFTLPVDLRLARLFRRQVLDTLRQVAFGTTVSYAQLATAAGRPTAVRAAASACATNPVPIFVPCHRVVRSDRSLGGYLGGIEAKRFLLDLEAG
jgi:methylated-DNA-[protein]-cysteine S-methyltransferase